MQRRTYLAAAGTALVGAAAGCVSDGDGIVQPLEEGDSAEGEQSDDNESDDADDAAADESDSEDEAMQQESTDDSDEPSDDEDRDAGDDQEAESEGEEETDTDETDSEEGEPQGSDDEDGGADGSEDTEADDSDDSDGGEETGDETSDDGDGPSDDTDETDDGDGGDELPDPDEIEGEVDEGAAGDHVDVVDHRFERDGDECQVVVELTSASDDRWAQIEISTALQGYSGPTPSEPRVRVEPDGRVIRQIDVPRCGGVESYTVSLSLLDSGEVDDGGGPYTTEPGTGSGGDDDNVFNNETDSKYGDDGSYNDTDKDDEERDDHPVFE